MTTGLTRRRILGAACMAPIALIGPGIARASASKVSLTSLGTRLWLIQGLGGNVVVLDAGDSLLLVDGGRMGNARLLTGTLAQHFGGKPVNALINTHWHWDQSGYNATARKAGIDVIAHENTRLWLSTEVNSRWEKRVYPAQPPAALPNKNFFYGVQSIQVGGQKVEYTLMPQAHTDGDIYVWFPEDNLLVAGDVASPQRYPVVDPASNGWLGGMAEGLKMLIARGNDKTQVVAGSGAVCSIADLKQQREMCLSVLTRIGESYYKGQTWDELLALNPTMEFDARFGDPALFLRQSYDTAWYHVNEIRRVAR
jgi:cyclase